MSEKEYQSIIEFVWNKFKNVAWQMLGLARSRVFTKTSKR